MEILCEQCGRTFDKDAKIIFADEEVVLALCPKCQEEAMNDWIEAMDAEYQRLQDAADLYDSAMETFVVPSPEETEKYYEDISDRDTEDFWYGIERDE